MNADLPGFSDGLLSYSIVQGPGYTVVSMAGEIDTGSERTFCDALTAALARGVRQVVMDLAG